MIGKSVKDIRESKKISTLQLSKRSGVARGYICELELGKYKNPGLFVICKLCKALTVTPNDLIPEELYREGKNE